MIPYELQAPKIAYIWPIENVWAIENQNLMEKCFITSQNWELESGHPGAKPTKKTKKSYFFSNFGNIFQITFRPTHNYSIAKIQKLGEKWLSKLYVGSVKVPDLLFFHATISD